MKKTILSIVVAIILTSCTPLEYYQVYKIETNKAESLTKVMYDDDNCTISYNFWGEGGDAGFEFYNKTDSDINLDLTKTFFVFNGQSKPYYQNRAYSKTSTYAFSVNNRYNTANVSKGGSSSVTTTYGEMPILTIPGKTSFRVHEYSVYSELYYQCGYLKYPTGKSVKPLVFDKENTPITFSNIITYTIKGIDKRITNDFYVSEITNMPRSLLEKDITEDECGVLFNFPKTVIINKGASHFYNIYHR